MRKNRWRKDERGSVISRISTRPPGETTRTISDSARGPVLTKVQMALSLLLKGLDKES